METEFEKELAAAEYTLDSLKDYDRAYKSFEQISALHPENCRCWFGMLRAVTRDFVNYGIPIEQVGGLINHTLHTAAEGKKETFRAKIRTYLEARKKAQSEKCAKAESENAQYHAQIDRAPVLPNQIEMLNKEIILNTEKSRWGILSILWVAFFGAVGLLMCTFSCANVKSIFEAIPFILVSSVYIWVAAIPFFLKKRRRKKAVEMIQQKTKLEKEYNNIIRSNLTTDEELQQMQSEIAAIDRLLLNL